MVSPFEKTTVAFCTPHAFQGIGLLLTNIKNKPLHIIESNRLPIELSVTKDGTKKRNDFLVAENGNTYWQKTIF